MNSGAGDTTQLVPGFPIRTPWDHSSVDSSPRPIAASHVLHRLLVPRHPPCALSNLTTKMLASTVQFSTNTTTNPHTTTTTQRHSSGRFVVGGQGTAQKNNRLFFQDPTGCLEPSRFSATAGRTGPGPFHTPPTKSDGAVLGGSAVADE